MTRRITSCSTWRDVVKSALSPYVQTLLLATLLLACSHPTMRDAAEPARAAVVPPHDSSWAKLSNACPNDAPIQLAPQRAAPAAGRFRTQDDETAELSRQVPGGYGGLFIDHDPRSPPDAERRLETGHVVVFLVDTTQREAALRALASPNQPERPFNVLGARTRPARWSFAELYDWFGLLLSLGVRDGVTTVDIDEKENRIVFGVEDAVGRQRLERQLARLNLPCFLVGVRVTGPRVRG